MPRLFVLAITLAAFCTIATPSWAVLPVPTNCQNDVDGANDQPGQKDVTRYCVDIGNGSPYELLSLTNWDEIELSGNNTADLCTLYDTDNDRLVNLAVCTTLKRAGGAGGNDAVLSQIRLFTCNDTRSDRCTGSTLVAGPYTTLCEVEQNTTDPFSPATLNGPGAFFPTDTEVNCGVDLNDFGVAGTGARLLDACSYPSTVPNSDPSDCILFAACATNVDCDDLNPCTSDTCTASVCGHSPLTGSACTNGLFCDGTEICSPLGFCVANQPRNCNDSVACTVDSCDELTDSCVNDPRNSLCTDGAFCNGAETCNALTGCQAGTPVNCSDNVTCTTDSCNEATDTCDHAPSNAACNDGQFCNGVETCDTNNGCQLGTPPNCDDSVGCTADACNEATDSCDHTANNGACSDGLFCNGTETCHALNGCQAGSAPNCNDGVTCTADSCNEVSDSCDHAPSNAACSDGLFCNGAETCDVNNGCQAGVAPDCGDGVGCTTDACNEANDTCTHSPNNVPCNDGLFCNGIEVCHLTNDCQPGTAPNCNDGVTCTVDTCNEGSNQCDHAPTNATCNDGLFCNGSETCHPVNDCQVGSPPNCNDGVSCTSDSCDEATDTCDNTPSNVSCSDGAFCNGIEVCNQMTGCEPGDVPCTGPGVQCSEPLDVCVNCSVNADCDNGLFCDGAETCNVGTGVCQPGTPPSCNDGVTCTEDACNEITDTCDNAPSNGACSDGLFCTGVETCHPTNGCQAGSAPNCNDGVSCTTDACSESLNTCTHATNNALCSDGQFCTGVEVCDALGGCQAGAPPNCNDGVDCTGDSCNEAGDTCVNSASNAACSDGQFCNGAETCSALNGCQAAIPPNCNDGVGCTVDSCDEGADACANAPNNAACSDALFCNGTETCDAQDDCQAGAAPDCGDTVSCTLDSCNETSDSCDNTPINAACDDGLYCDGVEVCDLLNGCQDGAVIQCSDTFGCSTDSCNESTDQCESDMSTCSCGDGELTGLEECDPPAVAGTFEDCNNLVDDDGDGMVDCNDPGCDPNTRATICDEGCTNDLVCELVKDDPATIRYDWSGKPDVLQLHGRFELHDALNPTIEGVTFEISNEQGAIYRAFLDASLLRSNANGTRYKFLDKTAKQLGQSGIAGGLYKVGLIRRDFDGVPYVTFRIRAYGDFKFATKVQMTTQVSVGTATGALTADWTPVTGAWKLPLSEF